MSRVFWTQWKGKEDYSFHGRRSHGHHHTWPRLNDTIPPAQGKKGERKGQWSRLWPEKNLWDIFLRPSLQRWVGIGRRERWGGHSGERKRCEPEHRNTNCLGSKFSRLPSSAGQLNNVLDTYLHAYWLVFKVLLSGFNFIFKALDHLYPDYFWDCFFTLAPTLPLETAWLSTLIPELAWE